MRFDDPENPDFVSGEKLRTVALGTLIAGLVGGLCYFGVAQVYDSFMHVPLGAGLITGLLLSGAFKYAKLRARTPLIVCGVLAGLLAFAFRFELTGLKERSFLVMERAYQKSEIAPDADHATLIAEAKREITPLNVAWVYVETAAESGVSVSKRYGSGSETLSANDYNLRLLMSLCLRAGVATSIAFRSMHPKQE